jgi:hypothetical protein
MKMKKQIVMDTLAVILSISVLMLLLFNLAYGQTPGSQESGSPWEQDGQRPDGEKQGGHGPSLVGPPPEAYSACKDKAAGSASQLITPWGETIKGTCSQKEGKLVLVPDRPEGMTKNWHPCPPPPCGRDSFPPEWEEIDMIPPTH